MRRDIRRLYWGEELKAYFPGEIGPKSGALVRMGGTRSMEPREPEWPHYLTSQYDDYYTLFITVHRRLAKADDMFPIVLAQKMASGGPVGLRGARLCGPHEHPITTWARAELAVRRFLALWDSLGAAGRSHHASRYLRAKYGAGESHGKEAVEDDTLVSDVEIMGVAEDAYRAASSIVPFPSPRPMPEPSRRRESHVVLPRQWDRAAASDALRDFIPQIQKMQRDGLL